MRLGLTLLALGALATGDAAASSFVVLSSSPATTSRSILVLGPAEPAVAVRSTSLDQLATLSADQPALSGPDYGVIDTWERSETLPKIRIVSASVVAMGPPPVVMASLAPVEDEIVSAIPASPRGGRQVMPIVIRGGIASDAFSAPGPGPNVQIPITPEPSAPTPAMVENTPAAPEPPARERDQPAPPPPAPPTLLRGPE